MCPDSQARDTFLRSIQFKPTAEDGHMKHALKSEDVTLKRWFLCLALLDLISRK